MKSKTTRVLWILISLMLVAVACAPAAATAPPVSITVQLLWTHQAQFAGLYAADQLGYYAEEGLTVNFVEGGPTVDKFTTVLDGTAQFGVAGADELILARADGKQVTALAVMYQRSPVVFISLAEYDITRPQDFAGKSIRVTPNIKPTLNAMTAWVGVAPDQYTEVTLPSDVATFAAGEVQVWGAFLDGFALTVRQAGHDINIVYPDDYGVHFYGDTLWAADDYISQNPDTVLRFTRATLKGWQYAIENADQVGAMVARYKPEVSVELENLRMATMLPLINTGEHAIGWMSEGGWQGMATTLLEQGVLKSPLDVSQVYSMHVLTEIYGGN